MTSRARGAAAARAAADRTGGILAAWKTTSRTTTYLIERLPKDIWRSAVPGVSRFSAGMVAAHIHNSRCRWIKSLGAGHGLTPPRLVDLRRVSQPELVRALALSSAGIARLIELGAAHGGRVPRATWQNFPTDLPHFLSYFVAHEAHHRGQLVMVCRQLGRRLPSAVANGLWQWNQRARE